MRLTSLQIEKCVREMIGGNARARIGNTENLALLGVDGTLYIDRGPHHVYSSFPMSDLSLLSLADFRERYILPSVIVLLKQAYAPAPCLRSSACTICGAARDQPCARGMDPL